MAKEKKQDIAKEDHQEDHRSVKTPRPPQHIDPSSPPGKGRNKEDEKRGDIAEDTKEEE
jgi:hypothetical protein